MIDEPFKSHPVASPPSEGHLGTSAPGAPSAAPCERRWIAGCGRSRTAPSAQRRWSTLKNARSSVCWPERVPEEEKDVHTPVRHRQQEWVDTWPPDFCVFAYHQPVVHANFAKTASNRVDVLLVDPWLEQFDSEGCRNAWTEMTRQVRASSEHKTSNTWTKATPERATPFKLIWLP